MNLRNELMKHENGPAMVEIASRMDLYSGGGLLIGRVMLEDILAEIEHCWEQYAASETDTPNLWKLAQRIRETS